MPGMSPGDPVSTLSTASLHALLAALKAQGCRVPAEMGQALQDLCLASAHDNPIAQAQARVLLQQAACDLHWAAPRWDLAPAQGDPLTPWGSVWLGPVDGVWQVWLRSAQEGWHRLDSQEQALPPTPAPGLGGWLIVPQGLPQAVEMSGGTGSTMTGDAASTTANSESANYWGWVLGLLRGRVLGIMAASVLINLGLVILPLFAMLVYDKVVYNGVFETLWALAGGVMIFVLLELVVRLLRARQIERLALVLDERVDRHLFSSLLQPTGRAGSQPGMAARFLTLYRDLAGARDFFSANYLLAVADLPFVVLIWVVIALIAWPLMLVTLFWTLVYVLVGSYLKGRTLKDSHAVMRSQIAKQAVLTDALSSLDLLRTSHAGGRLFQRFMRLASQQSLEAAALRHDGLHQMHLTQVIYTCNFVSLLFVGAYLVFDQTITSGALVATSMLTGRTLSVVSLALQTLGRWNELQSALKALTPYLKDAPVQPGAAARRDPVDVQGFLALVQVEHRYGKNPPVLHPMSLRIAAGERVALLGRPGSGKSTLSRVIAGAMLPSTGEVRVDDVALLDHDASDRARWLAFKPQEPNLVAGTVEENILIGLPEAASQAQRMAALKRGIYFAGLDHDLSLGSLSLSQSVEEYGANLSGGQRQKVALARALATDARVLILDEPTNGLDPESEKILVTRLAELTSVTLILITHSARMLGLTQRVVVLDQGRVVADGVTSELVKVGA
jgi:ABC-type bacteriocin/lantibiotic exporter with double-glycine peptidase domain